MFHHRVQQPLSSQETTRNARLLDAIIRGDEEDVQLALDAGADVNATDAAGRSAVACAITGHDWRTVNASDASFMTESRLGVIRLLVEHPHVSLYSLNAPQEAVNGATPLGVAAWLNALEAIRVLVEDSAGAVSVNGMDSHGATALMYAARDGTIELVRYLLSKGARPDYRDNNYHTSVQFCLHHPQVLWLCENALRNHRTREIQSGNIRKLCPSALADVDALLPDDAQPDLLSCPPAHLFARSKILESRKSLVNAIISSDLPALRSLLFISATPDASQLSPATPRSRLRQLPG
ncbi:hypothetical protein EW146_g225 [Bondarzewia mesenterica]|uniref:Uncharacterized protein n=1 Tax=Bondarzewia mesenterica TaxID=1095465 RepID=A0A4S4MDZ1_9AGAM|nr:hypothetical protein EW146_g225 [Bondarzewia mesenterica]